MVPVHQQSSHQLSIHHRQHDPPSSVPTPHAAAPSIRLGRILLSIQASLENNALIPLRQHTFSLFDLQYLFLTFVFLFCYVVIDKPGWFKFTLALLGVLGLVFRRSRPFMLPFLAIAGWLILFYGCRFIPADWRPHIYTSVLPTLEYILYGGNLSDALAGSTASWKDLLAWLPYGIFHFTMPIIVAGLIVAWAPAGTLPVFARTFGYMNIAGVMTQLFFPCAPPCK